MNVEFEEVDWEFDVGDELVFDGDEVVVTDRIYSERMETFCYILFFQESHDNLVRERIVVE